MRATMAATSPIRPGMPIKAAGAKPIANASARSPLATGFDAGWVGNAMTDTTKARLAACAAIMINPSATLAGSGKGRLAADSAMSALYFIRTANTKPKVLKPVARAPMPELAPVAAQNNAVVINEKATANLVGQNLPATQIPT